MFLFILDINIHIMETFANFLVIQVGFFFENLNLGFKFFGRWIFTVGCCLFQFCFILVLFFGLFMSISYFVFVCCVMRLMFSLYGFFLVFTFQNFRQTNALEFGTDGNTQVNIIWRVDQCVDECDVSSLKIANTQMI